MESAIRLHRKSRVLSRVGGPGNGEDTAEDCHDRALTTSLRSGELTPLNRRLPRAVGQGWAEDNHATESNGHRSLGFEEKILDRRF